MRAKHALLVASACAGVALSPALNVPGALAAGAASLQLGGATFSCANAGPLYARHASSPVRAIVAFDGVKATLSASPAEQAGGWPEAVRRPMLALQLRGGPARAVPVRPPWGFSAFPGEVDLASLTSGATGSPFCVARFGGEASEVAALVGAYSGGAHCCTWVEAVVATPSGSPKPIWRDIGNPSAELKSYNGATLLVTADNSFAYTFDSYAGSGMPILVLELRGDRFVATTRDYPALVSQDARFWWEQYEHVSGPKGLQPRGGLGLLAPWVADECMLGRSASAWAMVARLQAQGRLDGGTPGWPRGAAYVKALRTFLAKGGYCPAGKVPSQAS